MKNIFKTALASILLMASCATDEEVVSTISTPDTFYASIEAPATRTYADEAGKLLWTANDQITIFKGSTKPLIYKFNGETGQNYGGFTNVTPDSGDDFVTANPLDANYAIYPHAANTTISNAGVFNFTIPATQNYAENSFGLGANVMVAVTEDKSDNNLSFKNLGGYFEFSLYGEGTTVKSIEFKGNNGENLAGTVAITASHDGNPTFEFVGEATKTLTLDCGAGVALGTEANPTTFWFVVPAMTYSNGITITITDANDKVMEKSTSKSITIERSTIQPLNAFLVETEEVIPNNQIWYTSSNNNIITRSASLFGNNINNISNTYNGGKGIMEFDGHVTTIGNSAFENRTQLTSISLPNSVTTIGNMAFYCCTYLTTVDISKEISTIGSFAFYNCLNLINITIPNKVKSIANDAFSGCRKLEAIEIPGSVKTIGYNAFHSCYALTSLIINDGVTSIGNAAFMYCNLTSINCNSLTPPTLGTKVFEDNNANMKIYVPAAAVETYKSANGWKDYANKIVGI